jgi:hypothetical protein
LVRAGVVKVTIGREGMMHRARVAGSMGLTTWAGCGTDELAAVDFIITAVGSKARGVGQHRRHGIRTESRASRAKPALLTLSILPRLPSRVVAVLVLQPLHGGSRFCIGK